MRGGENVSEENFEALDEWVAKVGERIGREVNPDIIHFYKHASAIIERYRARDVTHSTDM